jgi:hypothetical protein
MWFFNIMQWIFILILLTIEINIIHKFNILKLHVWTLSQKPIKYPLLTYFIMFSPLALWTFTIKDMVMTLANQMTWHTWVMSYNQHPTNQLEHKTPFNDQLWYLGLTHFHE